MHKKRLTGVLLFLVAGLAQILPLIPELIRRHELKKSMPKATSIGIIGGADGPTAIYVAGKVDLQTALTTFSMLLTNFCILCGTVQFWRARKERKARKAARKAEKLKKAA